MNANHPGQSQNIFPRPSPRNSQAQASPKSNSNAAEVAGGSIYALTSLMVRALAGLLTAYLTVQWYGSSMLGTASLIASLLLFSSFLGLGGLHITICKYLPEMGHPPNTGLAARLYRKFLSLVLPATFLLSGACILAASQLAQYLFHKPDLKSFIRLTGWFLTCQTLWQLNSGLLRAQKRILAYALLQCLPGVLALGFLVIATFIHFRPANPVYAQFAAILCAWGVSQFLVLPGLRLVAPAGESALPDRLQIIKSTLPVFLLIASSVVLPNLEIMLLGIWHSEREVGLFSLVLKFSNVAGYFYAAINTVLVPKFSELHAARQHRHLRLLAQQSTRWMLVSIGSMVALLTLLGPWLLGRFGREFVAGYPILVLMGLAQLVNAATGSSGQLLSMTTERRACFKIVSVSLIIWLALNLVCIPWWGPLGAGLAHLLGMLLMNAWLALHVRKVFGFRMFGHSAQSGPD